MRAEEYQILSLLKQITREEQARVKAVFERHCGKPVGFTPEELSTMSLELLIPLRDTLNGFVLTKQAAPTIKEAYERLNTKKLPRKVSFGRAERLED